MKGELSSLKSELNSLGLEEAKISDKMNGLRDANEMLLSKVKTLEAENDGMKQAIDLMRIEVQDMNANEQALVNKLKDIDFQNKQLLKESSSIDGESKFFKDKVRQLEIQLSQAVANERILNENLRSSEESAAQLSNELNSFVNKESNEYAALAQEVQLLQSQLNNIVGQEMALQSSIKTLELENVRLNNELQRKMEQMNDYTREISRLNQSNEKLIEEIESTQNMRVRLRNDIIGVIDQNDQVLPKGF
jgi:predicted  nucleic acid-binding Zn-ribbon protein